MKLTSASTAKAAPFFRVNSSAFANRAMASPDRDDGPMHWAEDVQAGFAGMVAGWSARLNWALVQRTGRDEHIDVHQRTGRCKRCAILLGCAAAWRGGSDGRCVDRGYG